MIRPTGFRLLVRPDKVQERTEGGLFVPVDVKERKMAEQIFGTVVLIGPTAWKAFDDGQPWAKVGDRVAFAKYGGFAIEDPYTKEVLRLLADEDIGAVITEGEN